MAVGDYRDFEFVGGPYDGDVLPVTEDAEGYPEILVLPHTWDEIEAKRAHRPPPGEWHRYERDGGKYRYLERDESEGA